MLAEKRRQTIQAILKSRKSATVAELATQLNVTTETIRRDLKVLEQAGALTRVHGGAFIHDGVENVVDSELRNQACHDEKRIISAHCLELINDGDAVFFDNSTTCYAIAQAVKDRDLTVVTNNLRILNLLSAHSNVRLVGIGGTVSPREHAFGGTQAVWALEQYYVDKAFFSCRTLSIENGVTESNDRWAQIRHAAIERSREHYLVADHTKFDRTSFVRICGYDRLTALITDTPLSKAWHEALEAQGCHVIDQPPSQLPKRLQDALTPEERQAPHRD